LIKIVPDWLHEEAFAEFKKQTVLREDLTADEKGRAIEKFFEQNFKYVGPAACSMIALKTFADAPEQEGDGDETV